MLSKEAYLTFELIVLTQKFKKCLNKIFQLKRYMQGMMSHKMQELELFLFINLRLTSLTIQIT
ncbi:MAG: hypothetical protein CMC18_06190, partial [Flavobacteriaceae bacterium]|nr:hypothetical protein [Flavobacteriaceae bacterium]